MKPANRSEVKPIVTIIGPGASTCGLPAMISLNRNSANSATLSRRPERSEEHTSELQSPCNLVCRLLLEKTTNALIDAADDRRAHPPEPSMYCFGPSDTREAVSTLPAGLPR